MTTYNASTVSDTAIASGKPITLQQGRAQRDNLIAAREGATGAPYEASAWHPYNGVTIGDGATGLFYDFAVHGAVASVDTPTFADPYEYALLGEGLSHNTGATNIDLRLYRETSAAYVSVFSRNMPSSPSTLTVWAEIYRPRIAATSMRVMVAGDSADYSNCFHDITPSQKISKAQLILSGATFDAGKIYLYKRLCHA